MGPTASDWATRCVVPSSPLVSWPVPELLPGIGPGLTGVSVIEVLTNLLIYGC